MKKNVLIVGAGNFAKIVHEYILNTSEYKTGQWIIKGFLSSDADTDCLIPAEKLIGQVANYQPFQNDVFVCAYVKGDDRKSAVQIIEGKNGSFINIIHSLADVASTAKMGNGNIIGAYATLSADTQIGDHNIVQNNANIGHDAVIGNYSHFYINAILCGMNNIGSNVSVFTGSIVYPKIKIEDNATIGAGSVVMRKVKNSTTVLGNPAKEI